MLADQVPGSRYLAVVLAAGCSRRYGERNKLVSEYAGKPLVSHCIRSCLDAGFDQVTLVVGHEAGLLRRALIDEPVCFLENPDHGSGMGSSIACAAGAARQAGAHLLLALGDMPMVRAATIRGLVAAHAAREQWVTVPTFGGVRGHPVLFGLGWLSQLRALVGDRGARGLLEERSDCVCEVPCDDPGVVFDVDEPGHR